MQVRRQYTQTKAMKLPVECVMAEALRTEKMIRVKLQAHLFNTELKEFQPIPRHYIVVELPSTGLAWQVIGCATAAIKEMEVYHTNPNYLELHKDDKEENNYEPVSFEIEASTAPN